MGMLRVCWPLTIFRLTPRHGKDAGLPPHKAKSHPRRISAVDSLPHGSYLTGMFNRLLLTLLALMTGFAAQLGPGEARASQVASSQVAVVGELTPAKAPRAPVALARLPEPGRLNTRRQAPARVATPVARLVPTVLPGIDRARE